MSHSLIATVAMLGAVGLLQAQRERRQPGPDSATLPGRELMLSAGWHVHATPREGCRTRLEYRDKEAPARGTYYYVRVWAKGDHYAWSSPVWVD